MGGNACKRRLAECVPKTQRKCKEEEENVLRLQIVELVVLYTASCALCCRVNCTRSWHMAAYDKLLHYRLS
jgi:hypothetical protein